MKPRLTKWFHVQMWMCKSADDCCANGSTPWLAWHYWALSKLTRL